MKRLLLILVAIAALPLLFVACGDDDDDDTNGGGDQLTTQERDQIQQSVNDYLAALRDQDKDKLKEALKDGTGDADVTRAMDRLKDHKYTLVSVTSMERDGDEVKVTLQLKDKDGATVTRTLEFERDQDRWQISDPELKE